MKSYDAIVVGGGHNGLVAAHYLRQGGLSVLVLERRHIVGGPCGEVEYFPGFRAAITNSPGSLEPKIVRDMRLAEFGLEFIRPNPSLVMPFPNGKAFIGWREQERVIECIRSFSERDARNYFPFFESLNRLAGKLEISLFRPPPSISAIASKLRDPTDEALFAKIIFGNIRDMLDAQFESEEVKACIAMLSLMSTVAGPSTPGTPYMLMQRPLSLASQAVDLEYDPRTQPLRGSTGLPKGGMGAIPAAMARSLLASGVEIRCNAAVTEIRSRDGKVRGVVLASGEEVQATHVISNLNPKTTLLALLEPSVLEKDVADRVAALPMRGNAFKIGLALDDLPRWAVAEDDAEARELAQCQFRIGPSMAYMESAYGDAMLGKWSSCPMFWGLTPSVTDPTLAPPGKHVMSINIFHAPYRLAEGNWESEKERFGEYCIKVLSEYIPNLLDIIIARRFWSPVDIEREYGLLEGNITHGDMLPGRMFSMRPAEGLSSYATPVEGLYLCGSGVWPGGYVSGLPGHNASHKLLADLRKTAKEKSAQLATAPTH